MKYSKILKGWKDIEGYFEWSRPTILKYKAIGLPIADIFGIPHIHIDNADAWFQKITLARYAIGEADDGEVEQ